MSTVELPLKEIGRTGGPKSMSEFFKPYPSLEEVLRGERATQGHSEATGQPDSQGKTSKTEDQ